MSPLLALLLVAVGLLVGAVATAAFLSSERDMHAPAKMDLLPSLDEDFTPPLDPDVLAILSALPGIPIVIGRQDKVVRAHALANLYDMVKGDEISDPTLIEALRKVRAEGEAHVAEIVIPAGKVLGQAAIHLSVRAAPVHPGHVLILATDMTEARRVEAIRRDFVANVSHELKTPVGAINLLAETILENVDNPEIVARFCETMVKESERLTALVHDIISLSRLESTEVKDPVEVLNVLDVVAGAIADVSELARQHSVTLVFDESAEEPPVWVRAYAAQLSMAIRNLIDNAIKYGPDNATVQVWTKIEGGMVRIFVKDEGPGIPADQARRVFERFYRMDQARTRIAGGTGLGLAIVKHVALNHGGTAEVVEPENQGATGAVLALNLPLVKELDPAQDIQTQTVQVGAQIDAEGEEN
ncbi:MAG: ATP-binding protein [Actinomycetaceae bacterium]|nr:ATP-binding protein [Actinomycetaceae bacterium]